MQLFNKYCRIFQAIDRLNEKRGWFGSEALKNVIKFFEQKEYANNPATIAKYARWAIRGDGPALYSNPTPEDCILGSDQPGYIVSSHHMCIRPLVLIHHSQPPDGPFESDFVNKIMTSFVGTLKGSSKTDEGFLHGALALTSIAVGTASCITFEPLLTQANRSNVLSYCTKAESGRRPHSSHGTAASLAWTTTSMDQSQKSVTIAGKG